MHNVQCLLSSIGKYSIGHARHVKTRNDNGLRIWIFSQKLPFSVGKTIFQRQILEEQYTMHIRHITNISDFVWFQRSCGSMKSASSFSSIDLTRSPTGQNNKIWITKRSMDLRSLIKPITLQIN